MKILTFKSFLFENANGTFEILVVESAPNIYDPQQAIKAFEKYDWLNTEAKKYLYNIELGESFNLEPNTKYLFDDSEIETQLNQQIKDENKSYFETGL